MATVDQTLMDLRHACQNPDQLKDMISLTVRPGPDVPCRKWSFNNQLITAMRRTRDARGYRQWGKVGRHVKKGSRAFAILAPMMHKRTVPNRQTGEDEERRWITFKPVQVFRYEDTEGTPIDYNEEPPNTMPPLFDVVEKMDLSVDWQGAVDSVRGSFNRETNEVMLFTDDTRTFFHEIAHAAHAAVDHNAIRSGYAFCEVVAELSAWALLSLYSPEELTPKYSFEYINAYAGGNAAKAVLSALATVGKVVKHIVELAGEETAIAA